MKKDGRQNHKQRYKCCLCFKRFSAGSKLDPDLIWSEYCLGKQTKKQLAERFKVSTKTIERLLKKASKQSEFAKPERINLMMDTTYFGRQYGVMVMFDSLSHQVLSVLDVKYETNALYFSQYQALLKKEIEIQCIICDGRQGLSQLFDSTPVQLCQFHQVSRVTQYLSRKPKSLAGQELRAITLALKESNKATFSAMLEAWYESHKDYINERSISLSTGKAGYAHRKLRSAYFSLKRNLERLFTFESSPEYQIPKTTNLLESLFGDLKQKLRCHQGLKKENKLLFIKDYFSKSGRKTPKMSIRGV